MSNIVDKDRAALVAALEELGGKLTAEEDIVFEGTRFTIPEKLDLRDAVSFLKEKIREDERPMEFSRVFNYRPWDGARATLIALKKAFGMVSQRSTMTMFGEFPPELRTIKTGVDTTEQVPWGNIAVPTLNDTTLTLTGTRHAEYGTVFAVSANGPRKHRFAIEGLFRLIEDELRHNSLYRGKAFDGQQEPEFLDLSGVQDDKIVYSDDVVTQLEANVWSLLRYTDRMRDLGLSLKRSVLFEGPYGTGKTLGAFLTAKVAVDNGWTFIMCRPGRDKLADVMATARLYQPSVVFFEDVDTITSEDSRDNVSELLDIFDGIRAKGTAIVAVLTTNHVDRIHKAVMRPGRLDAVVHIGALDDQGIQRLVEVSANGSLSELTVPEWHKVCESMHGFLPAFVKEATERAVRYSVARTSGGGMAWIDHTDLINAANGLRPQLQLMEEAHEGGKVASLDAAFREAVRGGVDGVDVVDDDGDAMCSLAANSKK